MDENPNVRILTQDFGKIPIKLCVLALIPCDDGEWDSSYSVNVQGYSGMAGRPFGGPFPDKVTALDAALTDVRDFLRRDAASPVNASSTRTEKHRRLAEKIMAWLDDRETDIKEELEGPAQMSFDMF